MASSRSIFTSTFMEVNWFDYYMRTLTIWCHKLSFVYKSRVMGGELKLCCVCCRRCNERQWDQPDIPIIDAVLLRGAGEQTTVDRLGRRFLWIILLHTGSASYCVWARQECTGSYGRIPGYTFLQHDTWESRSVPQRVRITISPVHRAITSSSGSCHVTWHFSVWPQRVEVGTTLSKNNIILYTQ
jgi:hypothetical protein